MVSAVEPVTQPPQVKPMIASAIAPPTAPPSAGFTFDEIFMMSFQGESYPLTGCKLSTDYAPQRVNCDGSVALNATSPREERRDKLSISANSPETGTIRARRCIQHRIESVIKGQTCAT